MTQDLVYIFDKITKVRSILGEVQSDFNIGLTIDGTKDSCAIIIRSYTDFEIEPFTVLWHEKTNTWWIVSHDKIERYQNEQGFVYTHELELLGAIDLLNARDLTDCGFNDNTYTIFSFISRLFDLSNFEIPMLFSSSISNNFLNKSVNFIKTFENYTLLSALREFLDAYNMCPKLTFDTHIVNNKVELHYARLNIISKTGDNTLPSHFIEDFDDSRETKKVDKNSFGTSVVSNAENVISSKEKRYPATGSVRLSSSSWTITDDNAFLRLPSKVFKGISITAHNPLEIEGFDDPDRSITVFPENYKSMEDFINSFIDYVSDHTSSSQFQEFLEDFNSKKEQVIENMQKASRVTLFEGNGIDPSYNNGQGQIIKGDNVPYLAGVDDRNVSPNVHTELIFTDKNTKSTLPKPRQGIAWERGSDLITGFEGLDHFTVNSLMSTDYQVDNGTLYSFSINNQTFDITIWRPPQAQVAKIYQQMGVKNTTFSVVYIPMSDIKIKVDNSRDKKDVQLYNQNGRITDGVALSKLLNSYSKEISSDNVVRYMQYTNFNDVPKVGSFVHKGNELYVINNVSMTFVQNETKNINLFNYYIDCEFNMSKYVSTKSLMVNPNTNIRDYGIPQNFNVKRKQLYRDFYEINYNINNDNEGDYYLDPQYIFVFYHEQNNLSDFIGVLKLGYDNAVEGEDNWYYQIETTNYYMDKMLYILLDFKDNNIIGYGSQNVYSGFDISKVLDPSSWTRTINTPISYVDSKGKVKSVDLLLCSNEQLTTTYQEYREEHPVEEDDGTVNLYNYSVFIPEEIYTLSLDRHSIRINEENYRKDALEVPVFEYACQIDDSDDVLIGDNILTQYDGNIVYFYGFVIGENLTQDNVADSNSISETTHPIGWSQSNGVSIDYESFTSAVKLLRIRLYNWQRWDIDELGFTNGPATDISQFEGKDIAIFRKAFNLSTGQVIADDLLFIAKKVPYTNISQDGLVLTLQLNHYKLN